MFFCSSSWSEMSEKLKATDCQLGKLVNHCQCLLVHVNLQNMQLKSSVFRIHLCLWTQIQIGHLGKN
jgi:hypothetical protein